MIQRLAANRNALEIEDMIWTMGLMLAMFGVLALTFILYGFVY